MLLFFYLAPSDTFEAGPIKVEDMTRIGSSYTLDKFDSGRSVYAGSHELPLYFNVRSKSLDAAPYKQCIVLDHTPLHIAAK